MAGVRLFGTMGAEASFREEDFFGREEELSALRRAAVEGGRGIGTSFMIYGPPNIGKTSLLLKLAHDLRSSPGESGPPRPFPFYFSFSQILSHPLALSQHFLQEYLWQLLRFLGDPQPPPFDPEAIRAARASSTARCGAGARINTARWATAPAAGRALAPRLQRR